MLTLTLLIPDLMYCLWMLLTHPPAAEETHLCKTYVYTSIILATWTVVGGIHFFLPRNRGSFFFFHMASLFFSHLTRIIIGFIIEFHWTCTNSVWIYYVETSRTIWTLILLLLLLL